VLDKSEDLLPLLFGKRNPNSLKDDDRFKQLTSEEHYVLGLCKEEAGYGAVQLTSGICSISVSAAGTLASCLMSHVSCLSSLVSLTSLQ